jgi:hypothetical protein
MLIVNFGRQMSRNEVNMTLIWSLRASLDIKLGTKRDELRKKQNI